MKEKELKVNSAANFESKLQQFIEDYRFTVPEEFIYLRLVDKKFFTLLEISDNENFPHFPELIREELDASVLSKI